MLYLRCPIKYGMENQKKKKKAVKNVTGKNLYIYYTNN